MFCRSLFWPLSCLTSELRIVITPLVSSNSFTRSKSSRFIPNFLFVLPCGNLIKRIPGYANHLFTGNRFYHAFCSWRKHDHRRPFRRPPQLSLQTRYCCILIFPSPSTDFDCSYYISSFVYSSKQSFHDLLCYSFTDDFSISRFF